MIVPVRIQRRRTRGFNLQKISLQTNGLPCVIVSRPTKWGNPWGCYDMFERYAKIFAEKKNDTEISKRWNSPSLSESLYQEKKVFDMINNINQLRGKNLACWCKPNEKCHADILLTLANKGEQQ